MVAKASVLGLDIGGSSSRARLSARGRVLAEAEGPGANVAALTPAVAERRLTALLADLGPAHPVACCAGAAGAEVPEARLRLEQLLTRLLPDCQITVVHDTRLVLAAAGLESGIALIAGTGSVAYGRDRRGRESRAGGWGWLVGDDGSGAWLAREAAREVMRRADAGEKYGPLGEAVLAAAQVGGAGELLGRLHTFREPGRWAALAHVVFDTASSDSGADALVGSAADGLAGLVERVRKALSIKGPVVLAGGLILNQARLESAVRRRLGRAVLRLEEPPVAGAVRIAEQVRR
ncbi:MAG TPA: BadF/BadG/BcrA/BcrD ATPase family protein [Candidatus Limnocylindria bacterium]|nr:BadF/BadG/BcrA/BcrD ATPase family protein [Candidatus Limnocylindria bacterium]